MFLNVFTIAMMIGFIVIVITGVLDGLIDGFADGMAQCLAVALVMFGSAGMVAMSLTNHGTTFVIIAVSAGIGIFSAVLFMIFYKFFKKHGERVSGPVDLQELVGLSASVLWWSGEIGEVLCEYNGHLFRLTARSAAPITVTAGQKVRIDTVDDKKVVHVHPEQTIPEPTVPKTSGTVEKNVNDAG